MSAVIAAFRENERQSDSAWTIAGSHFAWMFRCSRHPDKAASLSSTIRGRSEVASSKARWPVRDALDTEIKSRLSPMAAESAGSLI